MKKQKLFKRIILSALTATTLFTFVTIPTKAGTNLKQPENIKVSYADTLHHARMNATDYTKTYQWSVKNKNATQTDYAKFTLREKCFVELSADSEQNVDHSNGSTNVSLYADSSYKTELGTTSFDHYMIDPIFLELEAGTYYVKTTVKNVFSGKSFTGNLSVCAVRDADGIQIQQKLSKNKDFVTMKISANGFDGIETLSMKCTGTSDDMEEVSKKGFQIKKNGTYWFCIRTEQDYVIHKTVSVTGIDQTKPTVQGVKNGKTYKTATIRFSDKESGISKALLNGKKINSGEKISQTGTYTLKVWDRAGNLCKVQFQIQ
ncbi:MAG: hypothetical protein ACI4HI_02705 [Lachnospiraceae bacterium]